MALIKCPECGKEISDKAPSCPNCGCPKSDFVGEAKVQEELSSEEQTFKCGKCGRNIPVDTLECPYCGYNNYGAVWHNKEKVANKVKEKSQKKKRKIWKILLGIVGFSMIVSMCSSPEDDERYDTVIEGTGGNTSSEDSSKEPVKTTIESGIIYDGNDVVISTVELEEDSREYKLKLFIENKSELNLALGLRAYAVNGIMIEGGFVSFVDYDVAAEKKANISVEINKSDLEQYNIKTIKSVDMCFDVYENDEFVKGFNTGQITARTNQYDETRERLSGTTIYEEKGIRVEYISVSGNKYTYCLTNNSGKGITFSAENVTVNDFTSKELGSDVASVVALNDCQVIFVVEVGDEFMRENDINEVKKIEFNLEIRLLEDFYEDWNTGMMVSEF